MNTYPVMTVAGPQATHNPNLAPYIKVHPSLLLIPRFEKDFTVRIHLRTHPKSTPSQPAHFFPLPFASTLLFRVSNLADQLEVDGSVTREQKRELNNLRREMVHAARIGPNVIHNNIFSPRRDKHPDNKQLWQQATGGFRGRLRIPLANPSGRPMRQPLSTGPTVRPPVEKVLLDSTVRQVEECSL
jgi:hypothetical protein